ncbi:MAG: tetratricopeptide repeat protein [Syntrophaceae bacterium]|nr:tetratricopeptide repeat protein [Syntrophaceae bacterium]
MSPIFRNKSGTVFIKNRSKPDLGEHIQPSPAQTVPSSQFFMLKEWIFVIFLIAAVFLVYQPAWHGGLIWDDDCFVTSPQLRSGHGLFRIWFDPGATLGYYPVLHSVFWIQSWLWGNATLGYHLVNIMLHATAAVMVALILRRLAIPGAFLAAAIFAFHPVQVESVAWISELKNTLSAVFYLGSAIAYLRFDQQRRTSPYLWALGLFALSLLSKPVMVTLPGALLVIFWWQRGHLSWKKDILPLLPFFLLVAVIGFFTIWTHHNIYGTRGAQFDIPAWERVLIAGQAIWFYLSKLFWPAKLIFIYPKWETSQVAAWQYIFPLAAFALLVIFWKLRWRWRGPLAGLLFFIGTLFPVLGFFNVFTFIYSFVADHYQYLASLGIITLVAAGTATLLKRRQLLLRSVSYAICVLLLLTLAALTWRQSSMYTDIETLYNTTIKLNPTCWMAYNNMGGIYTLRGQHQHAIRYFNQAIRLNPDYFEAYNNRGTAYTAIGQYQRALEDFTQAIHLKSNYIDAYYYKTNYADGYYNRGLTYGRDLGQYQRAIEDFTQAIHLKPNYAEAYNNRAIVYIKQGKNNPGCLDAQKACELGICTALEWAKGNGLCR